MAQKVTGGLEAHITGPVSGQVAVGSRNVQVTAGPGAVVTVVAPEDRAVPRRRSPPVLLLPRPFPGLLGRQAELDRAREAGEAGLPVNVYGEPGIGKTALLRHLAHLPARAPDGTVYLLAGDAPASDVLQSVFEALYESDRPIKATEAQLRHLLGDVRAAILLDDVDLGRGGLDAVAGVAPGSWFVAASRDRLMWGEGVTVRLGGLPPDAGLDLFERELGRALTEQERPAARALCETLAGHPLRILQAAAAADRDDAPIGALAATPAAAVSAPRHEDERRMLGVLATVEGAPLEADLAGSLAGTANAAGVLGSLASRGLVLEEEGRYRSALPGPPADPEEVVEALTAWAEERHGDHRALRSARDALLTAFRWARAANRARTVLRLARALDEHLTLECRWGLWESVLEGARRAAMTVADEHHQAWALHQLGSRALCLEHTAEARRLLEEALAIRERIGDAAGAAVTQHNLELLAPPPEARRKEEPPRRPRLLRRALVVGLVLGALGGGGYAAWQLLGDDGDAPPVEDEPEVVIDVDENGPQETEDPGDPGGEEAAGEAGIRVPPEVRLPPPGADDVVRIFRETVLVQSTGPAPLRVTEAVVEDPSSGWSVIRAEQCLDAELKAEDTCEIEVQFAPGEGGSSTGLVIEHNAPGGVTRVSLMDARPVVD